MHAHFRPASSHALPPPPPPPPAPQEDAPPRGGHDAFHAHLLAARCCRPEQQSRQFTIRQLYDFHKSGHFELAGLNRHPVWDATKKRRYVWALIQGKVAPPLFVNYVRAVNKRFVYDGGNRFHAILEFIEGRLHIYVGNPKHPERGCYQTCRSGPDGAPCGRCHTLDSTERSHFDGIFIDVFEWYDLPEAEACQHAAMLNQGTPMNVSERLKLTLAADTPRAVFVREVFESERFRAARETAGREGFLKVLVVWVRTLSSSNGGCVQDIAARVRNDQLQTLKNFLESPDPLGRGQELSSHLTRVADLMESARAHTVRAFNVANLSLLRPNCDRLSAVRDSIRDTSSPLPDLLSRHEILLFPPP